MLWLEFNIARSEYQERNAKLNNCKEVEGYTVSRPGFLDRILTALRNRSQAPANRPVGKLAPGAAAR